MPYRPGDYAAAPDPGSRPAGSVDGSESYDWLTAVTGGDGTEDDGTGGDGSRPDPAGSAGGTGSASDDAPAPGTRTPVSTLQADQHGPGGGPSGPHPGGRDPWGRGVTRAQVGAGMHRTVRIGGWLILALLVSFIVGLVIFLRMTSHESTLRLDGEPTTFSVAQGRDVWVWVPEDAQGVRCTAQTPDGLALRDRPILRSLTNDDHVALWAVSTGGDGTVQIACEPDPDGRFEAPSARDTVRLSESPTAAEMATYEWFVGITLRLLPWIAATTALVWLVWGVLRAAKVLPPKVRRRDRRRYRPPTTWPWPGSTDDKR